MQQEGNALGVNSKNRKACEPIMHVHSKRGDVTRIS